ncbi:MAG: hypothetical protein WBY88_13125 [Desulfosarcina sp.]
MNRLVVFAISVSLMVLVELSNWGALPGADHRLSAPTGRQAEAGPSIATQTGADSGWIFVVLLGSGMIGLAGIGIGKR